MTGPPQTPSFAAFVVGPHPLLHALSTLPLPIFDLDGPGSKRAREFFPPQKLASPISCGRCCCPASPVGALLGQRLEQRSRQVGGKAHAHRRAPHHNLTFQRLLMHAGLLLQRLGPAAQEWRVRSQAKPQTQTSICFGYPALNLAHSPGRNLG